MLRVLQLQLVECSHLPLLLGGVQLSLRAQSRDLPQKLLVLLLEFGELRADERLRPLLQTLALLDDRVLGEAARG